MKKVIISILCISFLFPYSCFAQNAQEIAQMSDDEITMHAIKETAVGIKKVFIWARTKINKRKLKKMRKKNDPYVDCYEIDEDGRLDVKTSDCFVGDRIIKDLDCISCMEKQKAYEEEMMAAYNSTFTGFSETNTSISVTDSIEEAARIAEQKRIEEEKRKEEERRKAEEARKEAIKRVQETIVSEYAFDTTELSQTQLNDLDSVASILNQYAELKLTIIGHTCKIGYKNINLSKGLRRAESAKAYLLEKGIAEERITCDSKGELEPIVDNNSKENMAKNRRLEFVISE